MTNKRDNIYIYLWEEFNTVYVGRTINPKSRHYQHRHIVTESTYKFSSEHHVEHPKMIIIENDLSVEEGIEREKYWINEYKDNSPYDVLNKSKGGEIGFISKLTDEERKKRRKEWRDSYRLTHKEELQLKGKIYREKNKDKINEYRQKNKERISLFQKQYAESHKEEIKTYQKEYFVEHKNGITEYKKMWRELHKDEIRRKNKIYRETHKDEIRLKKKLYRDSHKLEIAERDKKYRETNKEKLAISHKKYTEEHKEKIAEYKKVWYEANKERILSNREKDTK